jgi:hypothetical protein
MARAAAVALIVAVTLVAGAPRASAADAPAAAPDGKAKRVYFVGNSVTDTVKYGLLAELAKSRGWRMEWGRHVIPGTPLFLPLREAAAGKASGFTEKPYGDCKHALENFQWDVVTLQPFDRLLENVDRKTGKDEEGDLVTVNRFIALAAAKSPDAQFYIYARWPRITVNGKGVSFDKDAYDQNVRGVSPPAGKAPAAKLAGPIDSYEKNWLRKYTGGWDGSNESRDYFETLTRKVREANPGMKKPVRMIPAGHVLYALDQQFKAGKLPGYKGAIEDLYADGIHLNNKGSYVVACTFFATIFGEDPAGLPAAGYQVDDAAFVKLAHETIWEVVRGTELAGVGRP